MNNIEIRSLGDWEKLPVSFAEETGINIYCDGITINGNRENGRYVLRASAFAELRDSSRAVLRDSSRAVLWDSSNAVLWDSSNAVLWDSSRAVLRDSSRAVLWDSSRAVLRDSSHAVLLDDSRAVLRDSSHAVLLDDSRAVLRDSSRAVLCGSSHAVLRDSSRAVLRDSSYAKAYGTETTIDKLLHHAVVICEDDVVVKHTIRHATASIIIQRPFIHSKESFLELYPPDEHGMVTLYKVTQDNGTDYYTGRIRYSGEVECPDWDDDTKRQCGGGLHLSPTPELALIYHHGQVLVCKCHVDDLVVYPHDITKVRCRKVTVIDTAKLYGRLY